MEVSTIALIDVMFDTVNILMHGMGTWLLLCTYMRGQKSTQTLYLINLALSELIKNMMMLIKDSLLSRNLVFASWYPRVFFKSGVFCHYMFSMFYITGDRLLHVILNVKYPVYWSVGKTKRLLICTWTFCLAMSTSLTLVHHVTYNEHKTHLRFFYHYIRPALFIIYGLFAIVTYTSMFLQYARSQRNTNAPQSSLFNIFINSRFFVSVLLIGSCMLLAVIPELILLILKLASIPLPSQFNLYKHVSFRLSDFIDAIIYIFLQPDVRKLLLTKLSCGLLRNTSSTRELQQPTPYFVLADPAGAVVSDQGSIISNQTQTNNENEMKITKL
jgi:hypothetical protein